MNKPYDRVFKSLADDDPRGLLYLFGSLPIDAEAEVEVLDRELNLPSLAVDHVYRVRTADREWLAHFEVQTRYKADVPERLLWYAAALTLRFRLPIDTVLVLLVKRHAPATVPDRREIALGGIRMCLDYRVARFWELAPRVILESGRLPLIPWVTLTNAAPEDLRRAWRELSRIEDRTLVAQFNILGGLRYGKTELSAILAQADSMLRITREILEESSVVQPLLDEIRSEGRNQGIQQGVEQGLEQGLEQGRIVEARRALRVVLAARFPELSLDAQIDAITDRGRLEAILQRIALAPDADAARAAFL